SLGSLGTYIHVKNKLIAKEKLKWARNDARTSYGRFSWSWKRMFQYVIPKPRNGKCWYSNGRDITAGFSQMGGQASPRGPQPGAMNK
ncbi:hypothetical protein E2320_005611, partial [Naja naja]